MTKKETKAVESNFKSQLRLSAHYFTEGKHEYSYLVRSGAYNCLMDFMSVLDADKIEENILKDYSISVSYFRDVMYDFMNKGGVD